MVLKIPGLQNPLFDNSKDTGESFYNPKNPPQNVTNKIYHLTKGGPDWHNLSGHGIYENGNCFAVTDTDTLIVGIAIPDGTLITKAKVYAACTSNWTLYRVNIEDGDVRVTMATAAPNVEDKTILYGIIDNLKYTYMLEITAMSNALSEYVQGAIIEYVQNFA